MTIEELLRDRREKAIAAGSVPCPFCEFGFEVYTISNDVFKCSVCGDHPKTQKATLEKCEESRVE